MINEFLPVGSVVLLKEATRPIVIMGYMVVEENSDKIWDYIGCAYPIGFIRSDKCLMFQKEQIDKILMRGYLDEEGKKFIEDLEESVKEVNND